MLFFHSFLHIYYYIHKYTICTQYYIRQLNLCITIYFEKELKIDWNCSCEYSSFNRILRPLSFVYLCNSAVQVIDSL